MTGPCFGDVTARSPFALELREAPASYAATPLAVSRHRPRGRPGRIAVA